MRGGDLGQPMVHMVGMIYSDGKIHSWCVGGRIEEEWSGSSTKEQGDLPTWKDTGEGKSSRESWLG